MKRFQSRALLLFALLNVFDILTTWYDLHLGAHEGNPLAAYILLWAGFGGLILFKLLLVLVVSGGVFLLVRLKAYRTAQFILIVALCFGFLWSGFNILQALLHGVFLTLG